MWVLVAAARKAMAAATTTSRGKKGKSLMEFPTKQGVDNPTSLQDQSITFDNFSPLDESVLLHLLDQKEKEIPKRINLFQGNIKDDEFRPSTTRTTSTSWVCHGVGGSGGSVGWRVRRKMSPAVAEGARVDDCTGVVLVGVRRQWRRGKVERVVLVVVSMA